LIEVRINGGSRALRPGLDLARLLEELGVSARTVIVEKNGEVIQRERFGQEPVEDGDAIELIQLMGGG
jgi:thiamine biosynthesis protein ThiS